MGWAGRITVGAQRRIGLALAASALAHAVLMQAMEGAAQRRARHAAAPALSVTLALPPIERAQPQPRAAARSSGAEPPARNLVQTMPLPPRFAHPVEHTPVHKPAPDPLHKPVPMPAPNETVAAQRGDAALSQLTDPTYYGARSLDVFPKALTALDWQRVPGAAKTRATVFIDEVGAVNDVRAIEALTAELEAAARELLLRTRFAPAQKDGRVVKAQVVVNLE